MTYFFIVVEKAKPQLSQLFWRAFQKALMLLLSSSSPQAPGRGLFAVIIPVDPLSPYLTSPCSALPTRPVSALELDHRAFEPIKADSFQITSHASAPYLNVLEVCVVLAHTPHSLIFQKPFLESCHSPDLKPSVTPYCLTNLAPRLFPLEFDPQTSCAFSSFPPSIIHVLIHSFHTPMEQVVGAGHCNRSRRSRGDGRGGGTS